MVMVADGMNNAEIIATCPDSQHEDILEALQYAAGSGSRTGAFADRGLS